MLKNSVLIGLTAACLSSAAVSAQERVVRRVETTASGGREIHKLSVVMKSKVLIREDQPAGQIVDVVLSDGGCVEYLVATHEDRYYILPYQAADVRYTDQVVFVDIAPTQFKQVQFFSQDRWPDVYSTEYRQQVNNVFNVRVDADSRTRVRDRNDRDTPDRDTRNRDERAPRGANNKENPDRNARDRDEDKPTPRTDRTPREGDRPRAEDRGDNPPRPRTEDRDNPPKTPRTSPPADSATPPKREPGTPPAERDREKDEKPATPPPSPPKP